MTTSSFAKKLLIFWVKNTSVSTLKLKSENMSKDSNSTSQQEGAKTIAEIEIAREISAINSRYPSDLSTIIGANSQSSSEEKEREGWIMSVSKSFCGATAALMAVEGKFGEKRMGATALDVL